MSISIVKRGFNPETGKHRYEVFDHRGDEGVKCESFMVRIEQSIDVGLLEGAIHNFIAHTAYHAFDAYKEIESLHRRVRELEDDLGAKKRELELSQQGVQRLKTTLDKMDDHLMHPDMVLIREDGECDLDEFSAIDAAREYIEEKIEDGSVVDEKTITAYFAYEEDFDVERTVTVEFRNE